MGYNSTILELFLKSIERWKDVEILDAGPVCQENITFFARKIQRCYACDMFTRLHRSLGHGSKSGSFCQDLDYSPHSFDGIQLWDLVDHLDDDQARQLVARCLEMLRPTGLLMLIALEKKTGAGNYKHFRCRPGLSVGSSPAAASGASLVWPP